MLGEVRANPAQGVMDSGRRAVQKEQPTGLEVWDVGQHFQQWLLFRLKLTELCLDVLNAADWDVLNAADWEAQDLEPLLVCWQVGVAAFGLVISGKMLAHIIVEMRSNTTMADECPSKTKSSAGPACNQMGGFAIKFSKNSPRSVVRCSATPVAMTCRSASICPIVPVNAILGLPVSLQDRSRRLEWAEIEEGSGLSRTLMRRSWP